MSFRIRIFNFFHIKLYTLNNNRDNNNNILSCRGNPVVCVVCHLVTSAVANVLSVVSVVSVVVKKIRNVSVVVKKINSCRKNKESALSLKKASVSLELRGQESRLAFEEFDEVRRVVEAEMVGNLLPRHIRIAQQPFRLERHPVVDEGERRLPRTFYYTV